MKSCKKMKMKIIKWPPAICRALQLRNWPLQLSNSREYLNTKCTKWFHPYIKFLKFPVTCIYLIAYTCINYLWFCGDGSCSTLMQLNTDQEHSLLIKLKRFVIASYVSLQVFAMLMLLINVQFFFIQHKMCQYLYDDVTLFLPVR